MSYRWQILSKFTEGFDTKILNLAIVVFMLLIMFGLSRFCQALESNLFRAPIYQHALPETDFLVIRNSSG